MKGRVLIAAGSDPSGGAGLQADIKTVSALGAYAAAAVTAVTVQDTTGVHSVHPVPPELIEAQMRAVIDDIGADAVKLGMLPARASVEAVARALKGVEAPLVIDPVLAATSGARLADEAVCEALCATLLPRAALITPNAREASRLSGLPAESLDEMRRAARALLDMGAAAVLITGGDRPGKHLIDLLLTGAGERIFRSERIETRHTHGTGCTLAAAIAAGLAQTLSLEAAIERARAFVRQAIASAPGLGRGQGPLNHAHAIPPYRGS